MLVAAVKAAVLNLQKTWKRLKNRSSSRELYWPIAKPYQPTSPRVDRRVIGSTGAVWLDGDGDGVWTSAFAYAQRLVREAGTDVPRQRRLADSIVYATARAVGGVVWTQDEDFDGLPDVQYVAKRRGS